MAAARGYRLDERTAQWELVDKPKGALATPRYANGRIPSAKVGPQRSTRLKSPEWPTLEKIGVRHHEQVRKRRAKVRAVNHCHPQQQGREKTRRNEVLGVALGLRKCIGVAGLPHYSFGTLSPVYRAGFRWCCFRPV